MRKIKLIAAVAVLGFAGVACGGGDADDNAVDTGTTESPTGGATGDAAVEIRADNATKWDPANVTVKSGDTVKWTWTGTLPHDVVSDNRFDSGEPTNSGEYTQTFSEAGEIPYYCSVHGKTMGGTITVTA